MDIILHAHHADVSDSLKRHAELALQRIAVRLRRVVNAVVRFIGDGPTRRVEIALHGTGTKPLFAHADASHFGPALVVAVHRLESQINRLRTRRIRRTPPNGARPG